MSRLIDADALGIGKCNPDVFNDKEYAKGWNSAIEILQNAPTVDAVPVCRCEKCVYWDAGTRRHYNNGESEWDEAICDRFNEIGVSRVYTDANYFCAGGERKGGDE